MVENELDIINTFIVAKNFEEAKKHLVDLVSKDGKNIEALKLLGLCNLNLKLYNESKSNFETVVKYFADDAASWFYLANSYDFLGDFLYAKTAYLKVLELRENYIEAYRNLGVIYVKTKEFEKAIELIEKGLKIAPDDYLLYYVGGSAYLSIYDFNKSIEYLEKAVSYKPSNSQLYNNLGTAYLSIGEYQKALDNFLIACEYDSTNSLTYYNMGSILQIKSKHEEACEFFEKAYALEQKDIYLVSLALSEFKSGQYENAAKHYKKLISLNPEKSNFKYNLACCYEMLKEYPKATIIMEQLFTLNPKSKSIAIKLADLYLNQGNPIKAKSVFEHYMAQGLVSDDIYFCYANSCLKTGDSDLAQNIFKKVIELNPESAEAHKNLGVLYLSKRLFDYAKDEFEKAYSISPNDAEIVFEYANFLHAINDVEKAKEMYLKAIEINPENPNYKLFAAINFNSLNDLESAEKYVDEAMHRLSTIFALQTAAGIYYANKNYNKAFIALTNILEQDVKNVDARNLLALVYIEKKEYEKANNLLELLLESFSTNTMLLVNSAKCLEKMGNYELAKERLDKVLEVIPDAEDALALLKKVEKKLVK